MPEPIEVHKVAIESVTDASGLARLIDDGVLEADRVSPSSARPRATAA